MKKILVIFLLILLVAASGCMTRSREKDSGSPTIIPTPGQDAGSIVTPSGQGAARTPCKELKPLIILVEFPDATHVAERSFFVNRYNTQVNSYIQSMSYGAVCLNGEVTPTWYMLPHDTSSYRISSRNLEVNRTRVSNLIRDVLAAADQDYDFADYDFVVIQLGVLTPDYGMVGLCGHPGMLGWTETSVLTAPSGEVVNRGVAIFTAQAHVGTNFHDIAHILGGVKDGNRMVPCLYDHDLQAKPGPELEVFRNSMINIGYWDPMSCHFYRNDTSPPGICSWTRIRLGWLGEEKILTVNPDNRTEVVLSPLEDPSGDVLAVRIPITSSTYYLIENRAPIGVDKVLPDHGILIMFADDRIAECHNGNAPVKLIDANPGIPYLQGAAFDIGEHEEYIDQVNNLRIKLVERSGNEYRILIEPL
ncbi:MAG TPA: hypothetical protein PKW51_01795 [Methanoregulaceae archaeon]|nr:hypothetical protein [Methanoregulaceae archaeon]